ncbi:threonine/serine exporter family protein [Oribacterium parvum]|uniref:threonine/serine ThrE exporter family protein n=1 Tax=Oribacterium parvum TaxID=1501329 RepID=UPI0028DB6813|nr:threonine/serine exporter family protein [Oribacterium parvum]
MQNSDQKEMQKMQNIDELETVLYAGNLLLSSGAEIYRAEETMHRIADAMHIKDLDAYVTNRGIFASGNVPGKGIESRIMSVPDKELNIDKIEAVNELSREVCSNCMDLSYLRASLHKIADVGEQNVAEKILSYFLGAGCFSYAIGTSFRDSLCAAIIGSLVGFYMIWSKYRIKSRVLITIIASVLTAVLSHFCVAIGLGSKLSFIIIGAMMDLVPGVAFVNSVREFSQNNFATGQTLLTSALLTCVSMASGVALVEQLVSGTIMTPSVIYDIPEISYIVLIIRSLAAGLGTIAFALMFRVRKRHFVDCGVLGTITWFAYMICIRIWNNEAIAVFVSGFAAVLASRVLAVLRRCPATVFLMTSLIPLLPGISLYRTIYYLLMGSAQISMHFGKLCFLTAFTIAVSIAVVQQIPRNWTIPVRKQKE